MEKFPLPEIKNSSSIGQTQRIDFDSIPNSNIVYQEKRSDDPKGFSLYKPSPFVSQWNSQFTSNGSSGSFSDNRSTGQIQQDLFKKAYDAALSQGFKEELNTGAGNLFSTKGVSNNFPGIDKYGWYNMNSYVNNGGYYFIGNNYENLPFPSTNNSQTYKLVNGKWIVTQEGDSWTSGLASAGGKMMVGDHL